MDAIKNIVQKNRVAKANQHIPPIAIFLFVVILVVAVFGASYLNGKVNASLINDWIIVWMLIGIILLFALKVASQWEKAVVLRLGKFLSLRGPGAFWIVPIIDTIPTWIDSRVMVTPFSAEKTLTKDTVPVNVDAVLFWVVWGCGEGRVGSRRLSLCDCLGRPDCFARHHWTHDAG